VGHYSASAVDVRTCGGGGVSQRICHAVRRELVPRFRRCSFYFCLDVGIGSRVHSFFYFYFLFYCCLLLCVWLLQCFLHDPIHYGFIRIRIGTLTVPLQMREYRLIGHERVRSLARLPMGFANPFIYIF
jgi:hypothetical protein